MDKKYTVADFKNLVEANWPESGVESWDRVGLLTGAPADPVNKVLLAVDVTKETVREAVEWGADMLFTHHPLLLRGIHTVSGETSKGSLATSLIRSHCALLSAHTNADITVGGVSDVLAEKLGLKNVEPIVKGETPGVGIGRVGELSREMKLIEVAEKLVSFLPKTAVGARVAGEADRKILKVALLGGSGDSLLDAEAVLSADVYITSDLRHHPAQEALEQYSVTGGPALIDIPHWASESLWLENAAATISAGMPGVETKVSKINTDPWTFRVG